MLKRIEHRIGRTAMLIGAFFLTALVLCAPVGILGSSNILWGEPDQYGTVRVPGSATVHLPSGDVGVNAALFIPGKTPGQTVDVPIPRNLKLVLTPASGTEAPTVSSDLGDSDNATDHNTNAQRKVFTAHVPADGDYTARASGSFAGVGINAQLWFGHGPPLPGTLVPVVAAGLALIGMFFWLVVRPRIRGRRPAASPGFDSGGRGVPLGNDSVDFKGVPHDKAYELKRLVEANVNGELSDPEFEQAKAQLLSE